MTAKWERVGGGGIEKNGKRAHEDGQGCSDCGGEGTK